MASMHALLTKDTHLVHEQNRQLRERLAVAELELQHKDDQIRGLQQQVAQLKQELAVARSNNSSTASNHVNGNGNRLGGSPSIRTTKSAMTNMMPTQDAMSLYTAAKADAILMKNGPSPRASPRTSPRNNKKVVRNATSSDDSVKSLSTVAKADAFLMAGGSTHKPVRGKSSEFIINPDIVLNSQSSKAQTATITGNTINDDGQSRGHDTIETVITVGGGQSVMRKTSDITMGSEFSDYKFNRRLPSRKPTPQPSLGDSRSSFRLEQVDEGTEESPAISLRKSQYAPPPPPSPHVATESNFGGKISSSMTEEDMSLPGQIGSWAALPSPDFVQQETRTPGLEPLAEEGGKNGSNVEKLVSRAGEMHLGGNDGNESDDDDDTEPNYRGLGIQDGTLKGLPRELSLAEYSNLSALDQSTVATSVSRPKRNKEKKPGKSKSGSDLAETYEVLNRQVVDGHGIRGVYTGSLCSINHVPEGYGLIRYHRGGRAYEGDWVGGHWDGFGTLVVAGGDRFDGNFKEGRKEGHGKMVFVDGRVFEGRFQQDQMREGKLHFTDGSTYDGMLMDGKRNGYGRYDFSDKSFYEGQWKDDQMEGRGNMQWNDGGFYRGDWVGGLQHGRGVEVLPNRMERHNGMWENGCPIQNQTTLNIPADF